MADGLRRTKRRPRPLRFAALGGAASVALLTLSTATGIDPPFPAPAPVARAVPPTPVVLVPPVPPVAPVPPRPSPQPWATVAATVIDRTTLPAEGVVVPEGGNVFAARVVEGGPSPAYVLYEAGGGAFAGTVYPASSIKVLAALGALELAYDAGFTGDATVDGTYRLWEYYDSAIRYSSNDDYDLLVRIAGVAWLNEQFLPAQGYRATRIQEPYADGGEVRDSAPIRLAEDGHELDLPERHTEADYGCGGGNCSNLFELVDSLRRVVLHDELAPEERFDVAPGDIGGLQDALLGAESWIGPGVTDALGPGAVLYSKPGWTSGLDCVDIGLVVEPVTARRYLIGVSAPDDGECAMLATMAAEVLAVVARHDDGVALLTDGSVVPVVDGRTVQR